MGKAPEFPEPPVKGVCCLTGQKTNCINRKLVISNEFTDIGILSAPKSTLISIDTFIAWKYGYLTRDDSKLQKTPERMSSWFCDGDQFIELNRQGVREYALMAEMPPMWTAYATTSYKKHGSLNAKVNTGNQRFWLFEMRLVDMSDMQKTIAIWNNLNKYLRMGIGRSILESLDCPAYLVGKIGLHIWLEFYEWAKPLYNSALYAFMCYLLPSQEELKSEH